MKKSIKTADFKEPRFFLLTFEGDVKAVLGFRQDLDGVL